jgi:WsaF, C-terminal domain/WsaF, N-terminal domain
MSDDSSKAGTREQTLITELGGGVGLWEMVRAAVTECRYTTLGPRLNLLIPVISGKWASVGGPATALRFFAALAGQFQCARIVVTHETASQVDLTEWPDWVVDDGSPASRSLVFLGDKKSTLALSSKDYFIATAWMTAVYAKELVAQQRRWFSGGPRRFVYLVQDYEPAFYAWSARYVLAKSTYGDANSVIAVFNSRLLADYFSAEGIVFGESYVFEPMLHPRLRQLQREASGNVKERVILAYCRPSFARNDFDLVVEALRAWANGYPAAHQWSVLSAGEQHQDMDLGGGVVLRSRGKVTLEEYGKYLSRCWIGVSFMFSPHPSYPPLEMAEFGAWVITNSFANKDLASQARNILTLSEPTPREAAARIAWCCDQYGPGVAAAVDGLKPLFARDGAEFPFAGDLAAAWKQGGV